MIKDLKVHEKFLYEIWKEQNFEKGLINRNGEQITIIGVGVENKELGGPDFKNARIKIGNITYLGDVEIDSYYTDWKAHGHHLNKKYNKVILHAVLNDDLNHNYVYTQNGRKVQSISIHAFIKDNLKENIRKAILSERKNRLNKMPCFDLNDIITVQEKLDFLYSLGIVRFKDKCDKMMHRLKEITYLKEMNLKEPVIQYDLDEKFYNQNFTQEDFNKKEVWMQLIYESVFESLGYSKNKVIMQNLAKAVDIDLISNFSGAEHFVLIVESILFNVSGIIPDVEKLPDEETSGYTKKLAEYWSNISSSYDGKIFHAAQWHFFRLRPQNFPTIRIAGGARILKRIIKENLIANFISKIEGIKDLNQLTRELKTLLIVRGEGFWHNHFVFDQPAKNPINYFVGSSRADEILINIMFPIFFIYFEIFSKRELSEKVIKLFVNYCQKSENNLVKNVSFSLHLNDAWKRSVIYQGMIELFRSFCTHEKCLECNIGKKVFN